MSPLSTLFYRSWIHVLLAFVVAYYLIMDVVLYNTLQKANLGNEAEVADNLIHHVSIFHPLTIRLLVLDHTNHYIIKPLTDTFNYVTSIYHVVSTQMIIVAHVAVSIVVGKFVSSDSILRRMVGVALFEVRTWLVCLAGVVYRSQHGRPMYTAFNGVYGTTLNTLCDVFGGLIFLVGVTIYLLKNVDGRSEIPPPCGVLNNYCSSRKLVVLAMSVYGLLVVMAYSYLAYFITHLEKFHEKSFPDPQLTTVQTTLLHSLVTWLFLWSWRFFTQQMFQYLAVAVVLDKTWEFIPRFLYVSVPALTLLMSVCYIYIAHMGSLTFGGEFSS